MRLTITIAARAEVLGETHEDRGELLAEVLEQARQKLLQDGAESTVLGLYIPAARDGVYNRIGTMTVEE